MNNTDKIKALLLIIQQEIEFWKNEALHSPYYGDRNRALEKMNHLTEQLERIQQN